MILVLFDACVYPDSFVYTDVLGKGLTLHLYPEGPDT